MYVCLSARISPEPHARSLPIFTRATYVHGLVLFLHVYDRPHCLSPGRGFLSHWKCIIGRERDGSAQRGRSICYLRLTCRKLASGSDSFTEPESTGMTLEANCRRAYTRLRLLNHEALIGAAMTSIERSLKGQFLSPSARYASLPGCRVSSLHGCS